MESREHKHGQVVVKLMPQEEMTAPELRDEIERAEQEGDYQMERKLTSLLRKRLAQPI